MYRNSTIFVEGMSPFCPLNDTENTIKIKAKYKPNAINKRAENWYRGQNLQTSFVFVIVYLCWLQC